MGAVDTVSPVLPYAVVSILFSIALRIFFARKILCVASGTGSTDQLYRRCDAAHLLHLSFDRFSLLDSFSGSRMEAAVHIAKWVLIYISVEWVDIASVYYLLPRLIAVSLFFDVHMFLMLRFHHTKPFGASR